MSDESSQPHAPATAAADNDDLDALLDEAMDLVDEQERQHEAEVKVRDAELDKKLQSALADDDAGSTDWLAEMMKAVDELKGSLSEDMTEESFTALKTKIDKLLKGVESSGLVGEDDKAEFTQVKNMLDMLAKDPQQAEQLANALSPEQRQQLLGEDAAVGLTSSEEQATLEQLKQNPAEFAKEVRELLASRESATAATTATTGATTTTTTGEAAPSGEADVSDELKDNLANMLLGTFRDPNFVEPIRVMRDAYDAWLVAHDAELSEEDKERYRKQHAKAKEVCDFLAVPLADGDDERVVKLLELMHEFSLLGTPPSDLADYGAPAASS